MSIDAATHSLAYVLSGVPGMFVSAGGVDGDLLIVHVNEDASEDDRSNLRKLARNKWEGFTVRIEGML